MGDPYNEPAFPVHDISRVQYPGMSLRDYFAAKALAVVVAVYPDKNYGQMATDAYYLADQMLKVRGENHE